MGLEQRSLDVSGSGAFGISDSSPAERLSLTSLQPFGTWIRRNSGIRGCVQRPRCQILSDRRRFLEYSKAHHRPARLGIQEGEPIKPETKYHRVTRLWLSAL